MSEGIAESDPVKYLDLQEFRDGGYLQEANRRFFHPLGLALEIVVDEEGRVVSLGGVWDYRDDPEGMIYGAGHDLRGHADKVEGEWMGKTLTRGAGLGFMVQPAECTECHGDPGYAGPCQVCFGL